MIAAADARYSALAGNPLTQSRQPNNGARTLRMLSVDAAAPEGEGLTLLTGRDLYTDRLSAARGDVNADLLHRGETLQIHPADAANLSIQHGTPVSVASGETEVEARAEVTEDVPQGAVWLPILHNRAAAQRLARSDRAPTVTVYPG